MAHLEQVIAHAERELSVPADAAHGQLASRLPLYKRFLKIENHRLRLSHQAGGGGREICRRRVGLLDVFLRHLFLDACRAAPSSELRDRQLPAMLAIGGYGRGELNPYSDVDLLFLHDFSHHKVPAHVNELIKQILYVLWDIGFKVGHATRSIREACEHANEDDVSKTALLESRFIAGRADLFNAFEQRFERMRDRYRDALDWSLDHRGWILIPFTAFVVVSLALLFGAAESVSEAEIAANVDAAVELFLRVYGADAPCHREPSPV